SGPISSAIKRATSISRRPPPMTGSIQASCGRAKATSVESDDASRRKPIEAQARLAAPGRGSPILIGARKMLRSKKIEREDQGQGQQRAARRGAGCKRGRHGALGYVSRT